jgi:hypothetical protein
MQPNVKQGSLRKPTDLITFAWEKPDTKGIDFIKNNQELIDELLPKELKK